VKWAGGKRQLLKQLLPLFPTTCTTYYEPFVGGGAVFFALASMPVRPWKRAVLADVNEELVRTYLAVRDQPRKVIRHLLSLDRCRESYLSERALEPSTLTDSRRAARLIYLLTFGFNGLYRVNREGRFNVPWGKRSRARPCNPDLILADSLALQGVDIRVADFADTLRTAGPADVVFADPPYVPINSASFIGYSKDGFCAAQQARLADLLRAISSEGARVIATNSDCPEARAFYEPFALLNSVPVTRRISAASASRVLGVARDLLIQAPAA